MPTDLQQVRAQLPPLFLERLGQLCEPGDVARVLESFAVPKRAAFRVNPLRGDVAATWDELQHEGLAIERVGWLDEAGVLPRVERGRLLESRPSTDRRIYVQNLSSMAAVVALDPRPGQEVLDLAAAPGGKTLMIASRMGGQGRLAAVEAVRTRFYKLRDNLLAHGASTVRLYLADGRSIGRRTPGRFDAVLLDAPCSAEARFHLERPASWSTWSPRKIREQSRKQCGLLRSAIEATRLGGHVLYCTCSFAPEENELVIQRALQRFPGALRVVPLELPAPAVRPGLTAWEGRTLAPELADCRRILPDDTWDALFLARLEKIGHTSRKGMA